MESVTEFKHIPLGQRLDQAFRMQLTYPDRVPVFIDRGNRQTPEIAKHKMMIPSDMTMSQFKCIFRKTMTLSPDLALFYFIRNEMIADTKTFAEVYSTHKEIDSFLYITYSAESTFG